TASLILSLVPYTTLFRSHNVGYYRLSAYWSPYRELLREEPPIRGDNFLPGTTFEDIAALYEFDRKLRTLVHDGIERIEIGLRTQLNEYLGAVGGALAYQDPAHFRPHFDHTVWTQAGNKRVWRLQKDITAIRHLSVKRPAFCSDCYPGLGAQARFI